MVLIQREWLSRDMTNEILVPIDGSAQAEAALEYALEEFPEATITAVHVIQLPQGYWTNFAESREDLPGFENAYDHAQDLLEAAEKTAADHESEIDTAILTGDPSNEIVSYAVERGFDQIVMGSHGRKGISRVLLGSVSEKVVRRAPMTVVVVREE